MVPGLGELHQRLKEGRLMTDLKSGVAGVGPDMIDSRVKDNLWDLSPLAKNMTTLYKYRDALFKLYFMQNVLP